MEFIILLSIFSFTSIFFICLSEIAHRAVYGKLLRGEYLSKIEKNLEKYTVDDDYLMHIDLPIIWTTSHFFSKYYIRDIGRIPRWSKVSKLIDEKFKKAKEDIFAEKEPTKEYEVCSECGVLFKKETGQEIITKFFSGVDVYNSSIFYCQTHKKNYEKINLRLPDKKTYLKELEVDENGCPLDKMDKKQRSRRNAKGKGYTKTVY